MSDSNIIPFSVPNPWASRGLDPDVVDAESATEYEGMLIVCRRAFSTAQGFMALFTGVDSTYTSVSANWHGTAIDPNEGSFAVVQTSGRLADLVGEVVRVSIGKRSVYAYVCADTNRIQTEMTLSQRAWLALAPWAQRPSGLQAKVEVMV